MTQLIVTDCNQPQPKIYDNADAAAFEAAFYDFASERDRRDLAEAIEKGCLYESWSGKSTSVIERSRAPLEFWQRMLTLVLDDNQDWEVR